MVSDPPVSEFSRAVPLSEIGSAAKARHLVASEAERTALARRFDLLSLESLEADVTLIADGAGYRASGQFRGKAMQTCVVSGDIVPADVDEHFAVRFVSEPGFSEEAEIELDADECDTLFHDGRTIDLGEAVAQSFALALDPFPRSPDAGAVLRAAGVKNESEVEPLGALSGLKDLLGKG